MKKKFFIFFLLIFYFFFQLSSLDYGTKINDINYIKNTRLDEKTIKNFIQSKQAIKQTDIKNNEKWIYRYKLYSINADEMMSIMMLSKIDIKNKIFDPYLYKYGGAFIYPLGLYYYLITKFNLLKDINANSILSSENLMDKVYFYGRLFILICFIVSGFIFYKCANFFTKKFSSLILTSIYLFVPGSIMFSQIIKPHWYALIWANLALLFSIKYLLEKQKETYLLYISIFLGLSIGSTILFLPYLFFIIFSLYILDKDNSLNFKKVSFLLSITFLIFFVTNPYIIINFSDFLSEVNHEYIWVIKGYGLGKGFDLNKIIYFFYNSFILGYGVLFTLVILFYLLIQFKNKSRQSRKILFLYCFLLFFGALIGSFASWHIQFKYIPYILPISLLFLSYKIKKKQKILLSIILFGTIIQFIPLKIAYYDENNNKYSTRLNSAKWLNENIIEKGKTLCQKDFVPYDYPPINFDKVIIKKECDYNVHVLRQPKEIHNYEVIIKRFSPRFQFIKFPLVFSHINPLIIVTMQSNF